MDILTITEVAAAYSLTPDTLRYYERIGLIPCVGRTSSGRRDYQEADCRWIEFIKCMRAAGLPVETLILYVNLYQQGDETFDARKMLLIEQRSILSKRMEDMQNTINRLDVKIQRYEDTVFPVESDLSHIKN